MWRSAFRCEALERLTYSLFRLFVDRYIEGAIGHRGADRHDMGDRRAIGGSKAADS
jgi:hypothetical protein